MKNCFKIGAIAVAVLMLLSVVSCVIGAEPVAQKPVASVPANVQPAPFVPSVDKIDVAKDNAVFGGGKKGDKGLKQIDPPKFDLPSPFATAGVLIAIVIEVVMFLLQIAVIAFVVWVVVRAVNRKRETGTVIPSKEEQSIFDIWDEAKAKLQARKADREQDLTEINKRLGSAPKKTAKQKVKQ